MSEVIGIGVDLCQIERMQKAIARPHFLERVFTETEIAYLEPKNNGKAQSAAAMFAAKEAVAKALGTGFSGGIMPEHIEVRHNELGAPQIALYGPAKERLLALGGTEVQISMSHEGAMALAFAAAVQRMPGEQDMPVVPGPAGI